MKRNILGIIVCMLLITTGVAMALDATAPYSVQMQWYIPSTTTFTVELGGSAADIVFNSTETTKVGVQPRGQDNDTNVPMVTILNNGNVALNFTHNVSGGGAIAGVTLKFSNATKYNDAITLTIGAATAVKINESVAPNAKAVVYFWTDFAAYTPANNTRIYQIQSGRYSG
jgi:hypothetical protein